jgi:uncharacterized protein (DUF2062 family)
LNYWHSGKTRFVENRIVGPLYKYIKLGLSPVKLSIAISIGATLGLFPIFGTTTLICVLLAVIFKLNMTVLQVVNYLMLPLQLIILIPLIKAGEYIFSSGHSKLTIEMIVHAFKDSWLSGIKELGHILIMGAGAWAIIIIPLGIILFFILVPIIKKIALANKSNQDS